MVVFVWCSPSGDGVHGCVLGPTVRGTGAGGLRCAPGEPACDQAGEWTQERRAGLSVDPPTDELRFAARRVPRVGRTVSDALVRAPARATHPRPQPRGAAHAEGADADERAVGQRAEQHHGQDRSVDRPRHCRGRTRRRGFGRVPRPPLQGGRGNHRGEPARQLARRAPVRAGAGTGAPRHAARADRGVRGAHRRRPVRAGAGTGAPRHAARADRGVRGAHRRGTPGLANAPCENDSAGCSGST